MIRCPVCDQNVDELIVDELGYGWCKACDFALKTPFEIFENLLRTLVIEKL